MREGMISLKVLKHFTKAPWYYVPKEMRHKFKTM
jgi:hypothetical protein